MRIRLLACSLLAAGVGAFGQKTPPAPAPSDPVSWPARESHQGLTIAARPLLTETSYRERFPGHTPYQAGILALEVVFQNQNDKPIRLNLENIRLLVDRLGQPAQKIEPLSAEEVADRVLLQSPRDLRAPRLPIPGPRRPQSNRDKNWEEFAGRLRAAGMQTDVLAPNSTQRGFFYFDVNHHYDWLSGARLDIPDLAFLVNNEALFFFQIDLAPAVR